MQSTSSQSNLQADFVYQHTNSSIYMPSQAQAIETSSKDINQSMSTLPPAATAGFQYPAQMPSTAAGLIGQPAPTAPFHGFSFDTSTQGSVAAKQVPDTHVASSDVIGSSSLTSTADDEMSEGSASNTSDLENVGMSGMVSESREPSTGPLRTRRGHQPKHLSISSMSTTTTSSTLTSGISATPSLDTVKGGAPSSIDSSLSEGRKTVTVGDHAFVIPTSSPKIPPQLQASARMTSTGRPSHARKVPQDHVKRPRNAFILFRSYACTNNLLPTSMGITDHRQVSRVVGQLWKGLKPEDKAIWEKLAFEEKEQHKINNPNYRYRPTYRKETPSKRRRKKTVDEEEMEEEDRKCEVVARVLLEGREVNTDELEKEVEEQKVKDQIEGRDRSSRSRSRSRSINSRTSDTHTNASMSAASSLEPFSATNGLGVYRPSSAPPVAQDTLEDTNYTLWPFDLSQPCNTTLQVRPKRSRTIANHGPDADAAAANALAPYSYNIGQYNDTNTFRPFDNLSKFSSDLTGPLAAPSPRTTANLQQHLFGSLGNGNDQTMLAGPEASQNGSQMLSAASTFPETPFLSAYPALKGSDPSLLSPSFTRKFSLGRWEVPHHPSTGKGLTSVAAPGIGLGSDKIFGGVSGQQYASMPARLPPAYPGSATDTTSSASSLSSGEQQLNYVATNAGGQGQSYGPAATAQNQNYVPTYVYLSKEDAQNPQIVEHYLSQGFGVSYDA